MILPVVYINQLPAESSRVVSRVRYISDSVSFRVRLYLYSCSVRSVPEPVLVADPLSAYENFGSLSYATVIAVFYE